MPKTGSKSGNQAGTKQPPKSHKTTTGKVKVAKKPVKPKKPAVKKPVVSDEMIERYFLKLSYTKFVRLTEQWNEDRLKLRLQNHTTYDGWLNYFKTLSVNQLKLLSNTGLDILSAEAYAALSFWRDIMANPSRIKNIHKAGLTTGSKDKTIVDYAKENNRMGVLESIRDELASKLQQGAGARDAGQLSAQMMEVMTQIEVYKRRSEPKKETPLGALLSDMPLGNKRPSENGTGTRHTRYASRVTIEDVEGEDG